jgi:hypothetical protein
MYYRIALFLHVTGALLLFAAMIIEWLCLVNFRKAMDLREIKESISNYSKSGLIGFTAVFLVLIPGIYMMAVAWKNAGWIITAFIGMILLAVIGGAVTGKKLKVIKKIISNENNISPELRSLLNNNSLMLSLKIRTAVFLGIIYLMTVKPDMKGSASVIIISIILGLIPLKSKAKKGEVINAEQKV